MKICITAQGPGTGDLFEERFGRAPWFILYDTETGATEAIQNGLVIESGGVGPKAVQVLQMHGVAAIITGMIGTHAKDALDASGIAAFRGEPGVSVEDTIRAFSGKKLPLLCR
jgi:predicted Fe-Mo cluster-binding NifX family protein